MKKTVETIKKQWLDASYQELHQVARQQVKLYMEELNVLYQQQTGYGFIRFMEERMKRPESIYGKLQRKGYEPDFETANEKLNDISGVRVIAYCLGEIYWIADRVALEGRFPLRKVKDYIRKPKKNGYESYHMILEVPVLNGDEEKIVPVELQLRTIVMDAWASMDTRISYKKKKNLPLEEERRIKKYAKLGKHLDCLIQETMAHNAADRKAGMSPDEWAAQQELAELFLAQRRKEWRRLQKKQSKHQDKSKKKQQEKSK